MQTTPFTTQNINFYNSPSTCISSFEKTNNFTKATSFIQSCGTLFNYALFKADLRLHNIEAQMKPYIEPSSQGFTKNKLVVCIHGLNNDPSQFKAIIDEMQTRQKTNTDIFIPRVLEKGNAKLDDLVYPILEEIKKWASHPGYKELVLVGISNGARIARAIETELANGDHSNIKKLRFISIVGACKGSSLANLVNRVGCSCLLSENISKEMPTTSKRNQRLNKEWTEGLLKKDCQRDYTFIASPHDWQVTNYDSSLMEVPNHSARYAIVQGHGHSSIVNAVAKTVAEIIFP